MCIKENIDVINVVRKESHFNTFKDYGAKYMVSTSNPKWKEELSNLSKDLNSQICFECVGGNYTGEMLNCLPNNSTLYHFGNLELKRLGKIVTSDLITKTIRGFVVDKFLLSLNNEERNNMVNYIVKDISNGGEIFSTKYSKEFKLENFVEALMYYLQNMSEGKVIIKA